jgi:hypothetical protein
MQMAEVGYEIKNHTRFIVGSEETEPGDGYTYDTFLKPILDRPGMSAAEVAKITAEAYTAHYAAIGNGATQSAVASESFGKLLPLLDSWSQAVMAAGDLASVRLARQQALSFAYYDNKDLLHLVRLINAGTKDPAINAKSAELENFLTKELIIHNAVNGDGYKEASGLAIYLPKMEYNQNYDELAWTKDGSWSKFIKWQLGGGQQEENLSSRK